MKIQSSLFVLFALCASLAADAAVWYVNKASSSAVEDGTGWSTAFKTLQPAIDAAANAGGGELWVAKGVYNESRFYSDPHRHVNTGMLLMRTSVSMYGGFAGTETEFFRRDWNRNLTVVDGSLARDGSNAYTVIKGAPDTNFDGFVVQGGRANNSYAGMVLTFDGSAIVRNCTFQDNRAVPEWMGGGAMFIQTTSRRVTIQNCTFRENSAVGASAIAGIAFYAIECTFVGNFASKGSAAITCGDAVIDRCIFLNNRSAEGGGGSGAVGCDDTLISNSVFSGNVGDVGGAIAFSGTYDLEGGYSTTVNVVNCSIYNNTARVSGGAIYWNTAIAAVSNNILWGNSPDNLVVLGRTEGVGEVSNNIIQGGHHGSGYVIANNLDVDPRFVNPSKGDLRITAGSPAVDSGLDLIADGRALTQPDFYLFDYAGTPRPQYAGFDIGAYEYRFPTEADLDGDNAISAIDIQLEVNALLGLSVHPRAM